MSDHGPRRVEPSAQVPAPTKPEPATTDPSASTAPGDGGSPHWVHSAMLGLSRPDEPYEIAPDDERRAYPRVCIRRDGKLLWRGLTRAVEVRTIDVSMGGARLHVPGPRLPAPGEAVEVVVVSPDRVLVPRASLRSATVLRVDEARGHVALRFDEPADVASLGGVPPHELAAA